MTSGFRFTTLCLAMVEWLFVVTAPAADLATMRIADLLAVPRMEAAKRPSIRVRATVSAIGEGLISGDRQSALSTFCIEDESAGIWVLVAQASREQVWRGNEDELRAVVEGSEIEIEGVMAEGAFAPVVLPRHVKLLGMKTLQPAQTVPLLRLMSGAAAMQRVQVSGVVQDIVDERGAWWLLKVETGLGHFLTRLPKSDSFSPSRLLDATVRMTGVVGNSRNWRAEFICPRLIICHQDDVTIEEPAPVDPFDVKKVPLSALDSFTPEGRPLHRRRIEGTVTFSDTENSLFIQDGNCAVRVVPGSTVPLALGDRVEATGFIDTSRKVAGLGGALIRRLGIGSVPPAIPVTMSEINSEFEIMKRGQLGQLAGWDNLLVSVTGRLLNVQGPASNGVLSLELDCGDSVSTVFLPGAGTDLLPGTELRAMGVASIQYAPAGQAANFPRPTRLDLLLRDASDITVLREPSWWTPRRFYWAVGVLLLLVTAAALWIIQLRRLVSRKSKRLEHALRTHRDSELEMKGAREERYRLASDLHDGLQQHLTGASYRLEAALMRMGELPVGVEEQFSATRAALERTRTGLRECLLGLRSVEEGPSEFPALVRHAVEKMEHWPRGAVEISTTGDLFLLSRHTMGSLLLFMQEAVANAFKHGAAECVRIVLVYTPTTFEIHVEDNGSGFDTARAPDATLGHFGLESMRHRLRWLGGIAEIQSEPGRGTCVIGRLARKKVEAEWSDTGETI